MTIQFLHTADWQIGKVFRFVDLETMGVLQDARLNAIDRLGEIAIDRELTHVLVAGDVYDSENLSVRSLNQPLERMRKYADVHWYLLPGNHDPYRSRGLWYRLQTGLPDNVHICHETKPIMLESQSAAILPAPLYHKATLDDPTRYMDSVDLPDGCIRIGLAHGSITTFGSTDSHAKNYIDPERPNKAGLSYLALGDWHGQRQINARCWYSGTSETDAFDVEGGGKALVVTAYSGTSEPKVESVSTGFFRWEKLSETVTGQKDIEVLENTLSRLDDSPERMLMRLRVEGFLSLEDHSYFDQKITQRFDAAFRYLSVNKEHLYLQATEDDLNGIDTGGFVRKAADRLKALSEGTDEQQRIIASQALMRLSLELKKLETMDS